MPSSVTGNGFRALSKLAAKVDLTRGGRLELNAALGEELIRLVRLGFRRESDPYGTPWKPLKYRSGRILQDTGRLRNGWKRSRVTPDEVRISPSVDYAVYHQHGTGGRSRDSVRYQPTTKSGRFKSRASTAKLKRVAHVRRLEFRAGTGGIPPRPMVPENGLPAEWRKSCVRVAKAFLKAKIGA